VRIGELQKKLPVRSQILMLLDEGAQLGEVNDTQLDGKKMTRLRLICDNPDRRDAEKIDLEKYAQMLRRTAETEEGQRDVIESIKKQRQLPEKLIHLYWLDPGCNYAVRRHERQYAGDILLGREDCTDFQKIPGRDLFLPRRITVEDYTADRNVGVYFKVPLVISVLELTEVKVEPLADQEFILDCKVPGQMIIDRRDRDHEQQFIVDENGERRALP
jgi:hypothetical protein